MSGGRKQAKRLWDVRSMEGLGVGANCARAIDSTLHSTALTAYEYDRLKDARSRMQLEPSGDADRLRGRIACEDREPRRYEPMRQLATN